MQSVQISSWVFKSAHFCGNPSKAKSRQPPNIENTNNFDFPTKLANFMGDAVQKWPPPQQTQAPTHTKANHPKRVCKNPNGKRTGTNTGKSNQTHSEKYISQAILHKKLTKTPNSIRNLHFLNRVSF